MPKIWADPRVLCLDPDGNLLVSLTHQGKVVALPDKDGNGVADAVVTVLEGLNQPHGLAFGPGTEPEALRGRNHGSGDL